MCLEEMSELTKALLKYRRYSDLPKEELKVLWAGIISEIADVLITTEQMAIHYGEESVKTMIKFKIDRLAGEIHKEV